MNDGNVLKRAQKAYLKAILAKDKAKAWHVIAQALVRPFPTERVYLEVIGPAQRCLEELTKKKKISAADERLATAVSEFVVSRLYLILVKVPAKDPKAVVACVPSNTFELGAHVMGDFLEADGWQVRMIGSGLPVKDIMKMIKDFKPKAVFLCVSKASHLAEARAIIRKTRRLAPKAGLFVGGDYIFFNGNMHDKARKKLMLMADGFPQDALDGIVQARQFLQRSNGRHAA